MNKLFLIIFTGICLSCNPLATVETNISLSNNTEETPPVETTPPEETSPPEQTIPPVETIPEDPIVENFSNDLSIKRFDQINETFAKATEVASGTKSTRNEFIRIKSTLPLSNDAKTFTSFSIVAITSLSLVYCQEFVQNNTIGNLYFGINRNDHNYKDLIAEKMIRAMAYTDYDSDTFLQNTKLEMVKVMTHQPFTEDGITYNPVLVHGGSSATPISNPLYESIQGCALFLSSPYFTFNEL